MSPWSNCDPSAKGFTAEETLKALALLLALSHVEAKSTFRIAVTLNPAFERGWDS